MDAHSDPLALPDLTQVSTSRKSPQRTATPRTAAVAPSTLKLTRRRALNPIFLPWVLPFAALLLWIVATEAGWVSRHVLPKPVAVAEAAIDLFRHGFVNDIAISTRRAFSGFALGAGIGLVLGMIAGLSRTGDLLLDTSMQMKRTVPTLAILPLIIIWFGIGETMRTVLIALGALFPVYLNTYYGMRSADPALLEVGRIYGLRGLKLFRRIVLPAALPSILVGLRFALGGMWLTLIAAEMIGTTSGIGFVTNIAREFMQTDNVLVILFLYAALGKGTDMLVREIERRSLPWHPGYNGVQGGNLS